MDSQSMMRKIVFCSATFCAVASQIFFLIKRRPLDKVYLVTMSQELVAANLRAHGRRKLGPARRRPRQPTTTTSETLVESKSNLPNVDSLVRLYYLFSICANTYFTLKYCILCAIDLDSMRDYRFLDCYLVGRLTLNGRTVGLSKYIALCLCFFHLVWRFVMLALQPNFSFPVVEFLLMRPEEVVSWEAEQEQLTWRQLDLTGRTIAAEQQQLGLVVVAAAAAASGRPASSRPLARSLQVASPGGDSNSNSDSNLDLNLNLYSSSSLAIELKHRALMDFKNPFFLDGAHAHSRPVAFIQLRPNRTLSAWRAISSQFLVYLSLGFASFLVAAGMIIRMAAPMLLTQTGFVLNYQPCVEWVARQPNRAHYAFIYPAIVNETLPTDRRRLSRAFVRLENLLEPSPYQVFRFCMDWFDSTLIYLEIASIFVVFTAIAFLVAADIRYYCNSINERLEQMRWPPNGVASQRGQAQPAGPQTVQAQALIKDMLASLAAYNPYASFAMLYIIAIWFSYSAACSSWLFVPGDLMDTSKLELYIFQALATAFISCVIGSFNSVRRANARLYRSISALAGHGNATETGATVETRHWQGLMRHFSPKPLHCFTTFSSAEISWLLSLNMFTWLASALVVASSFLVHAGGPP